MKAVIQANVFNQNGAVSVAPNASIAIRDPDSGALIQLYEDRDGNGNPGNPFLADSRGFFRVYADPGTYHVYVTTGAGTQTYLDVPFLGPIVQTGYLTKSVAGSANVALTASEQSNAVIEFTGELTGNINVTVGDDKDGYRWTLINSTTGSFTLTFKATSGTGAVIDQGAEAVVYHDGTNIAELLTVTSAGKALLDDATADAQLDTLGGTTVGKAVFKAANEAAAQSALGLGSAATRDAAGAGDVYARGGILGTVSQSGGIPTGAIIERGSNANGEYVRFADGMQICPHGATTSASNDTTWTFPAAFISTPRVFLSMKTSVTQVASVLTRTDTTAAAVNYAGYNSAGRAALGVELLAIGRWF